MTKLITSGSLTSGISAADFNLPLGTALRCERPAEAVRPFVCGYFLMDSVSGYQRPGAEWMLPTYAQIWIVLTAGPISVSVRRRRYAKVPQAFVFGPTSQAMPITSNGGISVGLEVSPLGWARLFAVSAEDVRDQIVPLASIVPSDRFAPLMKALAASRRPESIKEILDTFFAHALAQPHRDETAILKVMRIVADETAANVTDACRNYDIDPRLAARIARRYFGFPLKLLMMRSRLLRAVVPMLDNGMTDGVPDPYHDRSHFLRNAKQFLGMTPAQYLAEKSVYVSAAWRARRLVLGVPIAALERAPN